MDQVFKDIVHLALQHLNNNPSINEDDFLDNVKKELTTAVKDLQYSRHRAFDPPANWILLTSYNYIDSINAYKHFKNGGYSTPAFKTQDVFNIIAQFAKSNPHMAVKHGAIYLKRRFKVPPKVSPYDSTSGETIYYMRRELEAIYRNDDYLDSKSMCLGDCYESYLCEAIQPPHFPKVSYQEYEDIIELYLVANNNFSIAKLFVCYEKAKSYYKKLTGNDEPKLLPNSISIEDSPEFFISRVTVDNYGDDDDDDDDDDWHIVVEIDEEYRHIDVSTDFFSSYDSIQNIYMHDCQNDHSHDNLTDTSLCLKCKQSKEKFSDLFDIAMKTNDLLTFSYDGKPISMGCYPAQLDKSFETTSYLISRVVHQ